MSEQSHPNPTAESRSEAAPSTDGVEMIAPGANAIEPADQNPGNHDPAVTSPGKVMRIGAMVKQLLEEVRVAPLDEASRERLAEVYERSVAELADALSEELQEELRNLTLPFGDDAPSDAELRVAKAQLVGWLEGLFHGIQATLFAQQMAARQQFEQMRQLPTPGVAGRPEEVEPGHEHLGGGSPGGVYL